jgi:HTH-type transcriptional regulator/antitoxin HigA
MMWEEKMSKQKELRPFVNIGPGHTIKKNLDALGWTQEDLASMMDISVKQLSHIINNKARITIETARLLAAVFGTSAEFWVNLDTRYRIHLEQDTNKETSAQRKARIRTYMPVNEITKKGWFISESTADGYEKMYSDIWDTSPDDHSMYEQSPERYCARQNRENEDYTSRYTYTWSRIARIKAHSFSVPEYDISKLEVISRQLSGYTVQENGVTQVLRDLNAAGVKFLVLSHLSKTYLDGACFWDERNPVIVYTGRYDRVDNFWFTLAHEIAHVLLHLPGFKDKSFLDDLKADGNSAEEQEADSAAEEFLKAEQIISSAKPFAGYLSRSRLQTISDELGIGTAVIVGILQHHKMVDYRKLNSYKEAVLERIPAEFIVG